MQFNYLKAVVAAIGLVCITVLMATSHLSESNGMLAIMFILGYTLGNGVAAATKKPVEPLMQRKPKPQEDEDAPTEP